MQKEREGKEEECGVVVLGEREEGREGKGRGGGKAKEQVAGNNKQY